MVESVQLNVFSLKEAKWAYLSLVVRPSVMLPHFGQLEMTYALHLLLLFSFAPAFTFQLCQFEPSFLGKPAVEWNADGNYQDFRALVNGFSPLNDAGERAVKFAADFNGKITRNEEQHEAMLQGVEEHRHAFPKPTKF